LLQPPGHDGRIRSKNLKLDAGVVAKGYTRADLFDAWARYLLPSPDNSATAATPRPPVALVARVADLPGYGPKCAHCGQPASLDNQFKQVCGGGDVYILHADCVTAADPDQLACRA
jgi:Protein of unknown function (DUF3631)